MKYLNCLIVDDEELARTLLANYIGRLPHLNIVGQCNNPLEAMPILDQHQVDILFLDIQMPEMRGTEFLKTLSIKPLVILTTAYAEYALTGYELDVVDYLLKPFSFKRFLQAVNKSIKLLKLKQAGENPQSDPEAGSSPAKEYILVNSEHKVHRIQLTDILYIQSMREYVAYYLSGKRVLSLGSLKKLEVDLPSTQFIRVHKSYIVAKDKVTTLEGNMVHIQGVKIPIGSSYRDRVLKALF